MTGLKVHLKRAARVEGKSIKSGQAGLLFGVGVETGALRQNALRTVNIFCGNKRRCLKEER
jgi:hypothetical protein